MKNDPINPNHYKTDSGIQCIDVVENLPYCLGNAIKYAWRAGKKDNTRQDLEKCKWYLDRSLYNGERALFIPCVQGICKAETKFKKAMGELPEYNTHLITHILGGLYSSATTFIDRWIAELDSTGSNNV